jgi:hypothetical protein
MIVIRLKSWPFSAMISANNWLERGIETILDASFCLIMRPCHCSSSVLALFADDAIRQFCLICWPLLSRELRGVRLLGQRHFLPSKMAADARPPGEKGVSKRCSGLD